MRLESKNEFIRGAIAGSISAAVICLFLEILEPFNLVNNCWLFMAGQPVMKFTHDFLTGVFAFLIHLGVGAFWGVVSAFLFSMVFTDRYKILKGVGIGIAIFFLHLGLLSQVMRYPAKMRQDPLTMLFIFISYLLYGALTAFLLKMQKEKNPEPEP